jgi:hypothetical protein
MSDPEKCFVCGEPATVQAYNNNPGIDYECRECNIALHLWHALCREITIELNQREN